MISLISTISIVLIGLSTKIKQSEDKVSLLCFFMVTSYVSIANIFWPESYNSYYYLFCAVADLVIITHLSRIAKPNSMVLFVQQACKSFIYINLLGWVAYELYYEPILYNILCASLYIVILFNAIFRRVCDGMGSVGVFNNSNLVYSGDTSSSFKMQANKAEERP